MCRLTITIDQSVHTLGPVFDLIDATSFYVRSVRLAPVARSPRADVYLSLGGGSKHELDALLAKIRDLPAVETAGHILPAIWVSGRPQLDRAAAR